MIVKGRIIMIETLAEKVTTIYENGEFKNFDYLKEISGNMYESINNDITRNIVRIGEIVRAIYCGGEIKDILIFEYLPN